MEALLAQACRTLIDNGTSEPLHESLIRVAHPSPGNSDVHDFTAHHLRRNNRYGYGSSVVNRIGYIECRHDGQKEDCSHATGQRHHLWEERRMWFQRSYDREPELVKVAWQP